MANFTETTNYSFKKPAVGADTDQWGTHLNETIDGVDSQLKTLADSITSQQLEELGNVVNVTPTDDQFLRYNGTNWSAETVSIPDVLNDLSNVSGTPSSGDVLTYDGSTWSPASVTSAAVADGSVTNAKLHPSLQTVIGRILVTDDDDSPTDNQILVYSTSDAEWKYADQAGSTLQTLTDVSTTGLSDGDLMKYDGTAGEFVFIDAAAARTLLNVDVSGTDNSTPVTLNTTSHDYLTLSSQQITLGPIVLTDDVSGTLPIANGGTSAGTAAGARTALGLVISTNIQAYDAGLESISGLTTAADKMIYTTASDTYAVADLTAAGRALLDDADAVAQRTTLGLGTLATQSTITESQISDLQSYITASSTDTLTNKSGDISQWTNDSGYLTAESNDLSSVVTWANVPDANITQSSVTQHQAALSVTESQISDFGSYQPLDQALTDISGLAVTDGNIIVGDGANWVAESGSTARASLGLAIGTDVQAYDADTAKYDDTTANFTGTLQNGGSNVLVNADIGSSVQAAGSYLTSVNLTSNVTGTLPVANGGTGVTGLSSLDAADLGSNNGVTDATDGYVLTADGTGGTAWEAVSGGSAINNVVEDLSPQLGGSLDVNGQSIVSVSAGNIAITPDTTGKIILDGLSWPTADGSADQVLKTDGSGNLGFVDQSGSGGSGSIINTKTSIKTSSDTTTANNNTGTSGFNTGLTVDLNVSSSSNYVLVIANVNWAYDTGNDSRLTIQATKSGETTVEIAKSLQFGLGNYHGVSVALGGKFIPSVSGIWTFTVYGQSAGSMGINAQNGSGSTITDQDALTLVSSITVFEIQV
jgi:hypothetical protein